MGDHCAFLGESVDVLGFLFKKPLRDEEREVGVSVAGGLEHPVEHPLKVLPERATPRFDDHAASNRGRLGEIGPPHDLLIPLGVVLVPSRGDCRLRLGGHGGQDSGEAVVLQSVSVGGVPNTLSTAALT